MISSSVGDFPRSGSCSGSSRCQECTVAAANRTAIAYACFFCFIRIKGPLGNHCTVGVKCITTAIDCSFLLVFIIICLYFLTVRHKVKPAGLIFVFIKYRSNILITGRIIISNIQLQPTGSHSTIIGITKVIIAIKERISVCVVKTFGLILTHPAIKHTALIVKGISLAVDGLKSNTAVVTIGHGAAISLEIIPVVIGLVILAGILILNSNPLIGYHYAVGVDIIVVVTIIDQLINSHLAVLVQIVPAIAGTSPLIGNSLLVAVIVNPCAILLYPAGGCEGGHGCTNGQQRCC